MAAGNKSGAVIPPFEGIGTRNGSFGLSSRRVDRGIESERLQVFDQILLLRFRQSQ